jgi:arylsulfatase A-like enzyme
VIPRVLALLILAGGLVSTAGAPAAPSQAAPGLPNVVVILLDDLDPASVAEMPAVTRRLTAEGTTFSRFFATTPLCCPSRASILTGQYAHNHGVLRNTGEDAGFTAFRNSGHESNTLATMLDGAGYETALIGKYLNGYATADDLGYVPPGWDYWAAGIDRAGYTGFNYQLNVDGEVITYGRDEDDYATDVLSGYALDFLDRAAGTDDPFFLYLAPFAPHSPSTPAPRHKGQFRGERAPRTPAFNERNTRDKPQWVRAATPFSDDRVARIDQNYRQRLESLQAVDEMIETLLQRLDQQGVLSSTYLFFLSDNGYFMGEHRQPHGKDAPYDAAAHVPLILRGPGVAAGATVDAIALNVDLLPTILDFAGLAAPAWVDGRSLTPLLTGNGAGWRQTAIIEGFGKEHESLEGSENATPAFQALRSEQILFVEYETGERELYDLRADPFETTNLARDTPKTRLRAYARHLQALATCSGAACGILENQPAGNLARRSREGVNPGDQNSLLMENAARQRKHTSASGSGDKQEAVGGERDQTAAVRVEMPQTATFSDRLTLRVHVADVTEPGTIVVMLDPGAGTGRRERLGATKVRRKGWVTIDVTSAGGDSGTMTLAVRGRGGTDLSISTEHSRHAPALITATNRGTDEAPRTSARQRHDVGREHDRGTRDRRK